MFYDNWYVITGGPSSGKTTLLNELKKRGYNTIKEAARLHIENQMSQGISVQKLRAAEKEFQETVFRHKLIVHEALDTNVPIFFDRGYHDTVAYLEYFGHEVADFIQNVSNSSTYKKVFILDMLPYKNDEVRIEDESIANGLHEILVKIYKTSGHEIIKVPVLPVKERADFVLQHL